MVNSNEITTDCIGRTLSADGGKGQCLTNEILGRHSSVHLLRAEREQVRLAGFKSVAV
jgi:hypothetical protein